MQTKAKGEGGGGIPAGEEPFHWLGGRMKKDVRLQCVKICSVPSTGLPTGVVIVVHPFSDRCIHGLTPLDTIFMDSSMGRVVGLLCLILSYMHPLIQRLVPLVFAWYHEEPQFVDPTKCQGWLQQNKVDEVYVRCLDQIFKERSDLKKSGVPMMKDGEIAEFEGIERSTGWDKQMMNSQVSDCCNHISEGGVRVRRSTDTGTTIRSGGTGPT
jgi:hypothetical protein